MEGKPLEGKCVKGASPGCNRDLSTRRVRALGHHKWHPTWGTTSEAVAAHSSVNAQPNRSWRKRKGSRAPSPICRTGDEQSGTTGSSLTKEQQSNLDVLQRILKTQNHPVSTLALVHFLDWPRRNVPAFPMTGSSDVIPVW